ncbi:MAG: hypothetical protein DRJ96_08550 [Thermoprotei archaeon]|nr:MAG: hypothetical protein DRJ67_08570 [Thermoprotei archaeon]RLE95475.1 MAG: hypothetical protein DRJ96_08550 [Thermoprotei archaeon]
MIIVLLPNLPYTSYDLLRRRMKQGVDGLIMRRRGGLTIMLLNEGPRAWWLAIQALQLGGDLYVARRIHPLDLPSWLLELAEYKRMGPKREEKLAMALERWDPWGEKLKR